MTSTKGKCLPCRKVYEWSGAPLLRDARCLVHGVPLRRTSHLSYLPVVSLPALRPLDARAQAVGGATALSDFKVALDRIKQEQRR